MQLRFRVKIVQAHDAGNHRRERRRDLRIAYVCKMLLPINKELMDRGVKRGFDLSGGSRELDG